MPNPQSLGRNDPCWCGSGKKYKNCHLGADEQQAAVQRQKQALWDALAEFALRPKYEIALKQAGKFFFGIDRAPEFSDDPDEEQDLESALDYFIFDHRLQDGQRIIEHFSGQESKHLSLLQRGWLDKWQHAVLVPLEVLEVQRGQGVRVRDIHTGEEFDVREQRASEKILRGDLVFMRLMPMGDHYEFGGGGLQLPANYFGALRRYVNDLWLEYEIQHPDGTLEEFRRATGHLVNQFILNDIGSEMSEPPGITTPEGDLLGHYRATFDVLDHPQC